MTVGAVIADGFWGSLVALILIGLSYDARRFVARLGRQRRQRLVLAEVEQASAVTERVDCLEVWWGLPVRIPAHEADR